MNVLGTSPIAFLGMLVGSWNEMAYLTVPQYWPQSFISFPLVLYACLFALFLICGETASPMVHTPNV